LESSHQSGLVVQQWELLIHHLVHLSANVTSWSPAPQKSLWTDQKTSRVKIPFQIYDHPQDIKGIEPQLIRHRDNKTAPLEKAMAGLRKRHYVVAIEIQSLPHPQFSKTDLDETFDVPTTAGKDLGELCLIIRLHYVLATKRMGKGVKGMHYTSEAIPCSTTSALISFSNLSKSARVFFATN